MEQILTETECEVLDGFLPERFPGEELEEYLDTDEPYDKAGAYAIQGIFSKFIKGYEGDFENVVGLPFHIIEKYVI